MLILLLAVPSVGLCQLENAHWRTSILHYDFRGDSTRIYRDVTEDYGPSLSNPTSGSLELYGFGWDIHDGQDRTIEVNEGSVTHCEPVFEPGSIDTIFFVGQNNNIDGLGDRLLWIRLVRSSDTWRVIDRDSVPIEWGSHDGSGTIIRHANNRDYWRVALFDGTNGNTYYKSFLITAHGIHPNGVASDAARVPTDEGGSEGVASPDGKILATVSHGTASQVAHFDRQTGKVVPWFRPQASQSEDLGSFAFSPNSRYLYCADEGTPRLYQYDLSLPDSEIIPGRKLVYSGYESPLSTNLQQTAHKPGVSPDMSLAMDGKIYVARPSRPYYVTIACIPHPDLPAPACGLDSLTNGYYYDIAYNVCNTSYAPPKAHHSYVTFNHASPCSPQCVTVRPESDVPADEYAWWMPGAEQQSASGAAAQACYDSAGIYPVYLYSRWGPNDASALRDTMVEYVSIASHLNGTFEPPVREYPAKPGESISIPLQFELPSSIAGDVSPLYRIRYHLAIDTSALRVTDIQPAPGWKLSSVSGRDILTVEVDSFDVESIPSLLNLGTLTTTLKPSATAATVHLPNITFVSADSERVLCANQDADVIARITNSAGVPGDREAEGISVSARTNPFSKSLHVTVLTPRVAVVSVQLMDVLGRAVEAGTKAIQTLHEGPNDLEFNTDCLTPGTYFVRIATESGSIITTRVEKR